MKKLIAFACLIPLCYSGSAQESDWSLEVYYPVSIGDDFSASGSGVLGAGIAYRFAEWGKARLGATMDATWFASTGTADTDPLIEEKRRSFFLGARIFAETPLTPDERLMLFGGAGWALHRSLGRAFFDENGRLQGEDWNNGPALHLGLSYDVLRNWYLKAGYEVQFLSGDSPTTQVGLLKFGAGIRF